MRLLLVEDDSSIATSIVEAFRRRHDGVDLLGSAEPAIAAMAATAYDLAIIDVSLPGMDGFELTRHLRRRAINIPIMILTARDAVEDRVRGLNLGADDYFLKPFSLDELIARSQALIRRTRASTTSSLNCGKLQLDLGTRQASLDGRPLELTARESTLLEQLMLASPDVVQKSRLVDALGSWNREVTANAIEIYVCRLRAKLSAGGVELRTMRGLGYRLIESPIQ